MAKQTKSNEAAPETAPEAPNAEPTSPVEAPQAAAESQDSQKATALRLEAMEQSQMMLIARLEELSARNDALETAAKQAPTQQIVLGPDAMKAFTDATVMPQRQPIDLKKEGYKGEYIYEDRHGNEIFGLKVHEPDRYGNTHSLKSQEHFWQGDKEAFKRTFEKK